MTDRRQSLQSDAASSSFINKKLLQIVKKQFNKIGYFTEITFAPLFVIEKNHKITYNKCVCNNKYGGCFMNISNLASFVASADLSLSEKGIESAKVILTGFVVVFAVLILLILIIKLYSLIIEKAQGSAESRKKKKLKESSEVQKTSSAPMQPAKVVAKAPSVDSGISDEVVAVISAAVSAMYNSSQGVRVKSIKKSDTGRSAWANAGVFENTRPF